MSATKDHSNAKKGLSKLQFSFLALSAVMMRMVMMMCQGWLTKVSAHSADDLGYEPALIFLSNAPSRVIRIHITGFRNKII